jgi:hypothetical protein
MSIRGWTIHIVIRRCINRLPTAPSIVTQVPPTNMISRAVDVRGDIVAVFAGGVQTGRKHGKSIPVRHRSFVSICYDAEELGRDYSPTCVAAEELTQRRVPMLRHCPTPNIFRAPADLHYSEPQLHNFDVQKRALSMTHLGPLQCDRPGCWSSFAFLA